MSNTYTIRDLLLAVIDREATHRSAFARPADVAYYEQRSKAFQDAFDIHFTEEELPPGKDTQLWDRLFQDAITSYLNVGTPFSGLLEIPRSYQQLAEAFAQLFAERSDALREVHLDFLVALCERWYGEQARQTITSSDLLQCGFDDRAPAPDMLD